MNVLRLLMNEKSPSETSSDAEWQDYVARQKERRIVFLLRLHRQWSIHSREVRQRLLEVSPSVLIPDLVNIVAEYLDLEGTQMS